MFPWRAGSSGDSGGCILENEATEPVALARLVLAPDGGPLADGPSYLLDGSGVDGLSFPDPGPGPPTVKVFCVSRSDGYPRKKRYQNPVK